MLRLNSIAKSVFDASDIHVNENDKVRLRSNSSADSYKVITRKDIVSSGRVVACEYIGQLINKNPLALSKYNSMLASAKMDYNSVQRAHKERKLLYCAAQVCKLTGEAAPQTFEEFEKTHMNYAADPNFHRVLAAIDREILMPIFFDVIDAVGMGLVQWEPVGFGSTKEITVRSNDIFIYEDTSWGSSRSTSKNYLYAKTITLNPQPITTNATIKWYQDIVAGDAGRYYAAIMLGLYNKIYAKTISVMKKAITDNATEGYIPEGLTSETYSTANWITITDKVAAANGVPVDGLMAIGTRSALSNLLPVDGEGGAITGLQYGLGEAWFYNGYLPKAGGVDLFPVAPVIVPGTQNSTLDTIDTGDNIYILAKGLYRPLYGAYYQGTPITLTATPSGGNGFAQGTADFTIDINVTATMDIQPVFASKVGVVTSVYNEGAGG